MEEQTVSLTEFLCLACGFQGLGEKKTDDSNCPKCEGKLIKSDRTGEPKKILM